MKRREFVGFLSTVAVLWPLEAWTQPSGKLWRLAFLYPGSWEDEIDRALFDVFRAEMRKLGYVEGKNLIIDRRGAAGHYERLSVLVSELVALGPDAIVAVAPPAAAAAQRVTSTIPIVMWGVGDPVAAGFIKTLAHPGANITGVATMITAILNDLSIVASKSETSANRLFALESLGHWVGDIHQPMHVSFEDDRGGNKIAVSGCARNLHGVWDSCLVQEAVGSDATKAATNLIQSITSEKKALWDKSYPRDWANETFAITEAVTTAYCVIHGSTCDPPASNNITITAEYLDANKPIVREQLRKAGVRLAHILDDALGN
jgi:hypothetical protein